MKTYYGGISYEPHKIVEKEVEVNGEKMIMVNTQKYRSDLFYIAPFYHTEIPDSIKKLIVIDIFVIEVFRSIIVEFELNIISKKEKSITRN